MNRAFEDDYYNHKMMMRGGVGTGISYGERLQMIRTAAVAEVTDTPPYIIAPDEESAREFLERDGYDCKLPDDWREEMDNIDVDDIIEELEPEEDSYESFYDHDPDDIWEVDFCG